MHTLVQKLLYGLSIFTAGTGTLAMVAAKVAAYNNGMFLFRSELHWFGDSVTAFLLSITTLMFLVLHNLKNK